jgi:hypothetical protein
VSTPDTPDRVRGEVSPARLIGTYPGATVEAVVDLPSNAVALWIFPHGSIDPPEVTAIGTTTSNPYPCFQFPVYNQDDSSVMTIVLVEPTVDAAVTITWASAQVADWYVVADAGPRLTIDPVMAGSAASPGGLAAGTAIQIAGTDGTNQRVLLTDSSGRLVTAAAAFPSVYGPPGAALPADALLVGGTDGTDLRALLLDTSGHQLTIDQNLKNVVGVGGAAEPSDAVMVAGSDGTDLRPLATGNTGKLLTVDQSLAASVGTPGVSSPADAIQVGGTDGGDLRALLTNKLGAQYVVPMAPDTAAGDHPPVELEFFAEAGTPNGTAIVAAPGAGKRIRVFAATCVANTAGDLAQLTDAVAGTAFIAAGSIAASMSYAPSGIPLAANSAVTVNTSGGSTAAVSICYTVETV